MRPTLFRLVPTLDSLGSTSRAKRLSPRKQYYIAMSEESFLRYRLEVVCRMPECAYKKALLAAISASLERCAALRFRPKANVRP